jgi:sporulation protein YhbH
MIRIAAETPWYELFSRGARDWLRHNQKVREAVRATLPELIANEDLITGPGNRTVAVPVKLLEHARLRLADPASQQGVGQGRGEPGDVLQQGRDKGHDPAESGGTENGEMRFVVELKVDEIVDWLWEELKLPELKPRRAATLDVPDYVREGWDKRGARSRLDRRKTMKEAVKRRSVQEKSTHNPVPITNDDLRFRQLVRKSSPATNAVVIFALDVSGSMDEAQRRLAKTFFFFALQGIRRQYAKVETAFLAHAAEAWEFEESQFFQASSSGGTVSSAVFGLANEILKARYDPSRYNVYFFYASDGENAADDRAPAVAALAQLSAQVNYAGYVETGGVATFRPRETQLAEIFSEARTRGRPVGMCHLNAQEDVWRALREFFREEAKREAA